jgi:hypothetical protein
LTLDRQNGTMRLMTPPGLLDATIHLFFAVDVGYEIDLSRARTLLEGGEAGPLPRRRRTPESIRYRPAPLRVPIGPGGIALPEGNISVTAPARAELTVFDFGAVSLLVSVPIQARAEALSALAGELADLAPQVAEARRVLAPWFERLRPAVAEFELSDLGEEYVVFQLDEVHEGWLQAHAAWVAGLVRCESVSLSASEVSEAIRLNLTYAPNDLVVIDWAAGLIADRQCADTLQVIEFANVQLLEFRHIDDRLDDRLEAAYRLVRSEPTRRRSRFGWGLHAEAVRRVRELELEATSLIERTENALKLIGDQYLSRVFGLASARFHLGGWQASVRRKLDTVGDVYDLLVEQASSRRMEVLELIVVILIALEIILALLRHP